MRRYDDSDGDGEVGAPCWAKLDNRILSLTCRKSAIWKEFVFWLPHCNVLQCTELTSTFLCHSTCHSVAVNAPRKECKHNTILCYVDCLQKNCFAFSDIVSMELYVSQLDETPNTTNVLWLQCAKSTGLYFTMHYRNTLNITYLGYSVPNQPIPCSTLQLCYSVQCIILKQTPTLISIQCRFGSKTL